jgi:hypothetical protein
MKRRAISFRESCERPCSLRLSSCGGPTASGLEGYACENCLSFIVQQFDLGLATGAERCGYCGSDPTYVGIRGVPLCGPCAQDGLQTARSWYRKMVGGAERDSG